MKITKILLILLFSTLLAACSSSQSDDLVFEAPYNDPHNYSFWTEGNMARAGALLDEEYTKAETEMNKLLAIESKTYMNFIRPYFDIRSRLEVAISPYIYLNDIARTEQKQALIWKNNELNIKLNKYFAAVDTQLKEAVNQIWNKEKSSLSAQQIKALESMLPIYTPSDARLETEIKNRLSALTIKFEQNMAQNAALQKIVIDDEKLLGNMPDSLKRSFELKTQQETDDKKFSTPVVWAFSSFGEDKRVFLSYITDRELRKKMYMERNSLDANKEVITEILKLKRELAELSGYANYAEYKNKRLSASSVSYVNETLDYLLSEAIKMEEPIIAMAEQLALKVDGLEKLEPYDVDYYMNMYAVSSSNINAVEDIIPRYFEKHATIKGILEQVEILYGIKLIENNIVLWNGSAKKYTVYDNSGNIIGTLFIDYDTAPTKIKGWYATPIGRSFLNKYDIQSKPCVALLMNLPPDSATGEPVLLSYKEITTVMHELGHAMHLLLPNSEEFITSGLDNIEYDNLEYPSYTNQYIPLISSKFIRALSKSIDNGTSLPEDIVTSYIEKEKYSELGGLKYTLLLSLIDIEIYTSALDYDSAADIESKLSAKYGRPVVNSILPRFDHIFAGIYDASYYTYIWGGIYAADALSYIKDESTEQGLNISRFNEYVNKFLKALPEKNFMDAYRSFRGEQFDNKAILELMRPKSVNK